MSPNIEQWYKKNVIIFSHFFMGTNLQTWYGLSKRKNLQILYKLHVKLYILHWSIGLYLCYRKPSHILQLVFQNLFLSLDHHPNAKGPKLFIVQKFQQLFFPPKSLTSINLQKLALNLNNWLPSSRTTECQNHKLILDLDPPIEIECSVPQQEVMNKNYVSVFVKVFRLHTKRTRAHQKESLMSRT